jgi:hypothetical protein
MSSIAGDLDPNRRPSRLIAAYNKAAARAREEAVAASTHASAASAGSMVAVAPSPEKPIAIPTPAAARPTPSPSSQAVATRRGRRRSVRQTVLKGAAATAGAMVAAIWVIGSPMGETSEVPDTVTPPPALAAGAGNPASGSESATPPSVQEKPALSASLRAIAPTPLAAAAPPDLSPHARVAGAHGTDPSSAAESVSLRAMNAPPARAATTPADRAARSRGVDAPAARTAAGDQWVSPTLTKLGVRRAWRASAIGITDRALVRELQQAVSELWIDRAPSNRDAIFLGVHAPADLAHLDALATALNSSGLLWTLVESDLSLDASDVVDAARAAGLTLRRRVALSPTRSAMSFERGSPQ